jgi:hypothetical protein
MNFCLNKKERSIQTHYAVNNFKCVLGGNLQGGVTLYKSKNGRRWKKFRSITKQELYDSILSIGDIFVTDENNLLSSYYKIEVDNCEGDLCGIIYNV